MITTKESYEALRLLDTTEEELATTLKAGFRSIIIEAGEWRPLAHHVAGLIALAIQSDRSKREGPK